MLRREKLNSLVARFAEIEARMAAGPDADAYVQLSREYADMEPIVTEIRKLFAAEAEATGLDELIGDEETDPEMAQLARDERAQISATIDRLSEKIMIMLLPKDAADAKGAILEVRAGTGGDEAALFAGDLFRMYQRYADARGWKLEILSQSEGEVGGYKEIVAAVNGKGVFARLKFESGVHRVQRVPVTESGGRIHTSAATVAVLPEAADVDIEIRPEDIRIDTMRASGAGGQHVNTTDSAVRLTHLPSGIVVTQSEKSQHQNRARALQVLRSKLYDAERQRLADERSQDRKGQVGSGDRSERIRTYNYPQGRMTDHRVNLTLYKLEQILSGDGLDEVIDALIADHQASLLAAESERT